VGLGKRLWDIARANVNDFTSELLGEDAGSLTPEERAALEREIAESVGGRAGRQARVIRDRAEDAWDRAFEASQEGGAPRGRGPTPRDIERWYRTLEVEPGADLDEVRSAYRKLVRKYHPDRYASDQEKYDAATAVLQRVTEAYEGLRTRLE
jgi:DnaJ-domain-containing protein 1